MYSCVCRRPMYHPAPPKTYLQIHMYHTFTSKLLVKLAYFLPPKKIWCDTYVSFFWQEPNTCTRRAVQRQAAGRIRTFSSVLSELFLRVFGIPCHAAARELAVASSPLLQNDMCEACCSQSSPLLQITT